MINTLFEANFVLLPAKISENRSIFVDEEIQNQNDQYARDALYLIKPCAIDDMCTVKEQSSAMRALRLCFKNGHRSSNPCKVFSASAKQSPVVMVVCIDKHLSHIIYTP